jgi:hypothetical protein
VDLADDLRKVVFVLPDADDDISAFDDASV